MKKHEKSLSCTPQGYAKTTWSKHSKIYICHKWVTDVIYICLGVFYDIIFVSCIDDPLICQTYNSCRQKTQLLSVLSISTINILLRMLNHLNKKLYSSSQQRAIIAMKAWAIKLYKNIHQCWGKFIIDRTFWTVATYVLRKWRVQCSFLNIKSSIYNLYDRITEVPIIISSITRGVCRRYALL